MWERDAGESERWDVRSTLPAVAGFEDGGRGRKPKNSCGF